MRRLTFEDRQRIEELWNGGATKIEIAAGMSLSLTAVYDELNRGLVFHENGDVVQDHNNRPAYSAERGHATYLRRMLNCGRGPKKKRTTKEGKVEHSA